MSYRLKVYDANPARLSNDDSNRNLRQLSYAQLRQRARAHNISLEQTPEALLKCLLKLAPKQDKKRTVGYTHTHTRDDSIEYVAYFQGKENVNSAKKFHFSIFSLDNSDSSDEDDDDDPHGDHSHNTLDNITNKRKRDREESAAAADDDSNTDVLSVEEERFNHKKKNIYPRENEMQVSTLCSAYMVTRLSECQLAQNQFLAPAPSSASSSNTNTNASADRNHDKYRNSHVFFRIGHDSTASSSSSMTGLAAEMQQYTKNVMYLMENQEMRELPALDPQRYGSSIVYSDALQQLFLIGGYTKTTSKTFFNLETLIMVDDHEDGDENENENEDENEEEDHGHMIDDHCDDRQQIFMHDSSSSSMNQSKNQNQSKNVGDVMEIDSGFDGMLKSSASMSNNRTRKLIDIQFRNMSTQQQQQQQRPQGMQSALAFVGAQTQTQIQSAVRGVVNGGGPRRRPGVLCGERRQTLRWKTLAPMTFRKSNPATVLFGYNGVGSSSFTSSSMLNNKQNHVSGFGGGFGGIRDLNMNNKSGKKGRGRKMKSASKKSRSKARAAGNNNNNNNGMFHFNNNNNHNSNKKSEAAAGAASASSSSPALEERIFVCGGWNHKDLSSCEIYNIGSDEWMSVSAMPQNLQHPGICYWAGSESVLTVGGYAHNSDLRVVQRFDLKRNQWIALPDTNYKHGYSPEVFIYNEQVIVVAGDRPVFDKSNVKNGGWGYIEYYDTRDSSRNNAWTVVGRLNDFIHMPKSKARKQRLKAIFRM